MGSMSLLIHNFIFATVENESKVSRVNHGLALPLGETRGLKPEAVVHLC